MINGIAKTNWLEIARLVLTSREIDRFQETELAPKGLVTYQFSAGGHELAQVLLGKALSHPHDAAGVYYRSRPFMLALGFKPEEAFAADLARTGSPSEGRDVGVVFSMKSRGGATVLPSSGDVGAQYTPIIGWAQAIRYYQRVIEDESWGGAIAVAMGGDASVASNGFWSALTIATTLKLPVLFLIEDNGYGISVPSDLQTPGGDISVNLASFQNLHILRGSGTAPDETAVLVQEAVHYVRQGVGPCLLRVQVPRLTGHTFGEDQSAYKSEGVLSREKGDDPIVRLTEAFQSQINMADLRKEVVETVQVAYQTALTMPEPNPERVEEHVFSGLDPGILISAPEPETIGPRINYIEAIRRVMETELVRNDRVVIFGEDVGPRGGVHRATLGLQSRFGEHRVFDTSLSEEGIIGRAIGMALAGLRPLPEIQFRKYADPAYEQIHDLGWLRWRTAGSFVAPVVVRIPVGYSKKTGDPWHSVSDEATFAHMQGWQIAFPSSAADATGLLRSAMRGQDPTLFLEHRALLDTPPGRSAYPGDEYIIPFGKAAVLQTGRDLTVVSWGEMVHRCLAAAQEFPDQIEILDLRTIIPWDRDAILHSVKGTGRLLIAHEDTQTVGFGAEISAWVAENGFTYLDAPIQRVTTRDIPIPYNQHLMDAVIPTIDYLRERMKTLLDW